MPNPATLPTRQRAVFACTALVALLCVSFTLPEATATGEAACRPILSAHPSCYFALNEPVIDARVIPSGVLPPLAGGELP